MDVISVNVLDVLKTLPGGRFWVLGVCPLGWRNDNVSNNDVIIVSRVRWVSSSNKDFNYLDNISFDLLKYSV